MLRKVQYLLILICAICWARSAAAFSLLGPLNAHAWQVPALGYNPRNFDIGNPMNLGEEYRYNAPVITYAFDSSFLNYFGQEGVNAVEAAIRILNNLPPASQIDVDDYPTENRRYNDLAGALGIQDLKSQTLSLMLEILGLAQPERWSWGLRSRRVETIGGVQGTNYLVIMRNFDPVTWQPTNRVNDTSYQYIIEEFETPNYADALEFVGPDPLRFFATSVAGGYLFPGQLFTGLTRDDAGGWKYLYRIRNYNVERLPTNTFRSTIITNINVTGPGIGGGGGTIGGGGTSNLVTSIPPWTVVVSGTNFIFGTNFTGTVPPWTPFVPITNISGITITNIGGTNVIITNIFGTNIVLTTNTPVDIALRPGIDKITFVRRDFDSLLGTAFPVFTNTYIDVSISNYTRFFQVVDRIVTEPDLLFGASDLGVTADNDPDPITVSRGVVFVNNDAINGRIPNGGPGVLQPPMQIVFTDILPVFRESTFEGNPPIGPDEFDRFDPFSRLFLFTRSFVWGSFDATDDEPIVFPIGFTIRDLERLVEGGGP